MPYCPRCGVEVEQRLDRCPLCDTAIPKDVREHPEEPGEYPEDVIPPKPLYRELTRRQKRVLATSLIIFLGLFPIAITLGIDLFQHGSVTWSYYVLVPVLGAALIAWFFFRFGNRPVISVTAMMIIILAIQLLIGLKSSSSRSGYSMIIPFFIASFIAVEMLLLYITYKRPKVLQLLDAILLDVSFFVCALDLIISSTLGWSLIVISCTLPVSLFFVYVIHAKKHGLNMAGFFFLDLTLMMLAIDLSTSGRISWSIVTTTIFVVIAALFYVLHIVLFNDTDWKKALHL
jgi:hypothetical protein